MSNPDMIDKKDRTEVTTRVRGWGCNVHNVAEGLKAKRNCEMTEIVEFMK
jgi:hypothetical protein